jgi:hypothetical protein
MRCRYCGYKLKEPETDVDRIFPMLHTADPSGWTLVCTKSPRYLHQTWDKSDLDKAINVLREITETKKEAA